MNDSHEIAEKVKQRTPRSHVGEVCEAISKLWGLGNSTPLEEQHPELPSAIFESS
jgi:hypothetical protein